MTDAQDAPRGEILAFRDGAAARLVVSNPAKRNAMSFAMWEALSAHLTRLDGDPDIRALILSGAGGEAFVSGADISKFESERASAEAAAAYGEATERVFAQIEAFARPVIAQIDGYCIGGGVALATACDIRICGQSARFAVPAARLGLAYPPESAARLVALIGPAQACDMLFTARRLSADEALQIGLVNRVLADRDVADDAAHMAQTIAANAPLTVAAAKSAVRSAARALRGDDLAALRAMVDQCFASADYVEGRRAFMDKRAPGFRGV